MTDMAGERWAAPASRRINMRIVIEGALEARSPLHLGSGDGDEVVDLPLLRDAIDGRPVLTGASLCGALRSYLRAHVLGDRAPAGQSDRGPEAIVTALFGGQGVDQEGMRWMAESAVVIDDTRGALPEGGGVELRSGVRLEAATRTAAEDALFNQELWPAGTGFPLRLEVALAQGAGEQASLQALATALGGLRPAVDGITLGARKRRGYGRVAVDKWAVRRYDLTTQNGLLAWLEHGHEPLPEEAYSDQQGIVALLGVAPLGDARRAFEVTATCALQGSLLIRAGYGADDTGPDMMHLHSRQAGGKREPMLPGTSLAGALRARALRIANTLYPAARATMATALVDDIFGPLRPEAQPGMRARGLRASRLNVTEQVVEGARADLVQNRVAIDRFTGGSYPGALFDEQPAFATPDTTITFSLRLVNPSEAEMGLLLLVLKDLWTADLPLGGEQAVGRGRVRGCEATLWLPDGAGEVALHQQWPAPPHVDGDRVALERYVAALHGVARGGAA